MSLRACNNILPQFLTLADFPSVTSVVVVSPVTQILLSGVEEAVVLGWPVSSCASELPVSVALLPEVEEVITVRGVSLTVLALCPLPVHVSLPLMVLLLCRWAVVP